MMVKKRGKSRLMIKTRKKITLLYENKIKHDFQELPRNKRISRFKCDIL